MDSPNGRTVANKWLKTAVLLEDSMISRYIPETEKFTPEKLKSFLSKYHRVVLKPKVGTGGHGLVLIKKNDNQYSVQYYTKTYRYSSFKEAKARVSKIVSGRSYLMQPGISLAKINGRPIDYRVKIVKTGGDWKITAMVGRLAAPDLFVTNLCRGGTQLSFKEGISKSLPRFSVKALRKEMRTLTFRSTQLLDKKFPGIHQLGFDFGVDRHGRIWFFEVNTAPH